mmetsp:Transcript_1894/g.4833  ORF Transcript_1894/g.4833 Transcript_1894/m.4833 type:complete len:554 (-) Transcript_1894:69-1730(-)
MTSSPRCEGTPLICRGPSTSSRVRNCLQATSSTKDVQRVATGAPLRKQSSGLRMNTATNGREESVSNPPSRAPSISRTSSRRPRADSGLSTSSRQSSCLSNQRRVSNRTPGSVSASVSAAPSRIGSPRETPRTSPRGSPIQTPLATPRQTTRLTRTTPTPQSNWRRSRNLGRTSVPAIKLQFREINCDATKSDISQSSPQSDSPEFEEETSAPALPVVRRHDSLSPRKRLSIIPQIFPPPSALELVAMQTEVEGSAKLMPVHEAGDVETDVRKVVIGVANSPRMIASPGSLSPASPGVNHIANRALERTRMLLAGLQELDLETPQVSIGAESPYPDFKEQTCKLLGTGEVMNRTISLSTTDSVFGTCNDIDKLLSVQTELVEEEPEHEGNLDNVQVAVSEPTMVGVGVQCGIEVGVQCDAEEVNLSDSSRKRPAPLTQLDTRPSTPTLRPSRTEDHLGWRCSSASASKAPSTPSSPLSTFRRVQQLQASQYPSPVGSACVPGWQYPTLGACATSPQTVSSVTESMRTPSNFSTASSRSPRLVRRTITITSTFM